ncbi:uroporphyrinogen-III C-methyltransferase [Geopsychrobacter electrodiphilus]|uniref:uroporphyrinogen-III C-methyltransferase n=1 Tax=Geopsychrobacter electrodiphilus TaxID=225196 RepID=UPI00037F0397|nr:uroporphyrinogen-III C-methyltransferase [Geopsychrobacter electrodiphilus]
MNSGKVYLIGAGPGDPGLLTVKGRDCLALADVVIYDYLANPVLLGYARPETEQIYVGKSRGQHSVPQEEINQLLVDKAGAGLQVARLKGGDPYVFGRGGEEAAFLRQHQIPFEVVPGVTAGFAAAAYAGIPLTHRDTTTSLALLTGHERPERKLSSLDWQKLATGLGTLIFYMGMSNLKMICEQLIKHGRAADTPVAVIQWATLPRQRTLTAPLNKIAEQVAAAGMEPPAVIIIGEVVRYREELRWYDNLPLFGKRFLITRPRAQAATFVALLQAQGAETICIPTIEIATPEDWTPCDQSLARLGGYHGVILTSANGVEAFFGRMKHLGLDLRALAGVKIIAVGPKTAKEIEKYGLSPDLVPQNFRAEGVVEELLAAGVDGKRFLYPRTAIARELIPDSLTAAGAEVDAPIIYRTIATLEKRDMIRHLLESGELDAICFSSSSTFDNLQAMFGDELKTLQGGTKFFSIGPLTSGTIRKHGFEVALEPEQSTLDDLVGAMVDYYKEP